jgi:hypothetical protein
MKKKIINKISATLLAGIILAGCNKPDDVVLANEGTVYMPQAVGNRSKIDLTFTTTNNRQEIVFGAAYGGVNFSNQDNNVKFTVDDAKVAAYNTANGTNYTLLSPGMYEMPTLDGLIPAGATSTNPMSFTVKTNLVTPGVRYMLPITLSTSSNGPISTDLQTTYFRFDTLLRKSIDITGQGTLTVLAENTGGPGAGEGSPKLVDNDINTKYLFFDWPAVLAANGGSWFKLQYATGVKVEAYTFTSANDGSTRDPKDWKLQGSDDGSAWTDLDTRSGEQFPNRFQTKRYEVTTPGTYKYYRIFMTANNGSTLFQMAEWRVIRYE